MPVRPEDEFFDELVGGIQPGPVQLSSSAPAAAAPSNAATPPAPEASPAAGRSTLLATPPDAEIQRTFQPIGEEIGRVRRSIGEEEAQFRERAGPSRTFRAIGGAGILGRAFEPEAAPQAVEEARSLIQARERHEPAALDAEDIAAIQGSIGTLRTRARSLPTVGGAIDILRERTPGLSPGELRSEAGRRIRQPEFRTESQRLGQEVGGLEALLARTQAETGAFARQRTAEEEAISKEASDFAKGRQETVSMVLQNRLGQERAYDTALEALYNQYLQTGQLETLAGRPGVEGAAEVIGDPRVRAIGQAPLTIQGVMGRYPDLADVPLLTPQTSTRGKAVLGFPKEWFEANEGRYSKAEMSALRQRAMERQTALEAAGFAPGVRRAALGGKGALREEDISNLAAIAPLYYDEAVGGPLELPETESFVRLEPGIAATRETVSFPREREIYNRAVDLLGFGEQIADPKLVRERPRIIAEATRYLDDLERLLTERKETLGLARDEDLAGVKKARKDFRKAVKAKRYKKMARIIGGVLTLGTTEGFEATGLSPSEAAAPAMQKLLYPQVI